MAPRKRAALFEQSVSPEVAANYRRLRSSKRVAEVRRLLQRRGLTSRNVEILLRNLASITQNWRSEHEPWKHAEKRRRRLGKKLHDLAQEIAADPDLGGWCFRISADQLNTPPEYRKGMLSLANLLQEAAILLMPSNKPPIRGPNEILSPAEFERRISPARRMSLRSYVLDAVFDLLHSFLALSCPDKARSLNRETEILASVLLKQEFGPGTVTQLRKKVRRRYTRDK
jgi:hypothetical protein